MSIFRVLSVELSKLYRQKRLYVFLLLPLLFVVLFCFGMKRSNARPMFGPEISIQMLNNTMPFLGFFFVIMTASYLIAEDYDSGTLKLSIMRPISRFTVFNAKFITMCISIITFYAVYFAVTFSVPGLFFGTQETVTFTENYQIIEFVGITMNWRESIGFIAMCYGLSSLGAIVLGSIMLVLSSAAVKPSVAITLSVIFFVFCYVTMSGSNFFTYNPWRHMYLFIPYFVQKMELAGESSFLKEMLSLMSLYFIVSYILSGILFMRRNILK